MKKLFVVFFTILLLSSCFGKEVKKENDSKVKESKVVSYEWIKIDTEKSNLEKKRWDIKLDDVFMIYAWESEKDTEGNELLDFGKKFISNIESKKEYNISENVNWGIKYSDFESEIKRVPQVLKRDLNLELTILDKATNKPISEWFVFVNNVNMWNFTNWEFKKNFKWPTWVEVFNVVIRAVDYWDGFLSLNSLNLKWSLLLWEVKMKKAIIVKDFDLSKKTNLFTPKFRVKFGRCSLVDRSGTCVEENVDVKINFLAWRTVNNGEASLNMRAITKEWNLEYLESGWMAFVDFTKKNWEILKLADWKTIEIIYKITDEDIKVMTSGDSKKLKNGYWWYDKNRWLWIESDASYELDKKWKTWRAVIKNLY